MAMTPRSYDVGYPYTLHEKVHKEDLMQQYLHDWLAHDITRMLLAYLESRREHYRDSWEDGVFTTETMDGTIQLNSKALGALQTLSDLYNSLKDGGFIEEMKNARSDGIPSPYTT